MNTPFHLHFEIHYAIIKHIYMNNRNKRFKNNLIESISMDTKYQFLLLT